MSIPMTEKQNEIYDFVRQEPKTILLSSKPRPIVVSSSRVVCKSFKLKMEDHAAQRKRIFAELRIDFTLPISEIFFLMCCRMHHRGKRQVAYVQFDHFRQCWIEVRYDDDDYVIEPTSMETRDGFAGLLVSVGQLWRINNLANLRFDVKQTQGGLFDGY